MTYKVATSFCALCKAKLPKRSTHLYVAELKAWICKSCWHKKND